MKCQTLDQYQKKTNVLVLIFVNPFEDPASPHSQETISIAQARENFFRLFKSIEGEQSHASLLEEFKNYIWWLNCPICSYSMKSKSITRNEFEIAMISAVLSTFKSLGLSYNLLKSRSKDEIYCRVITDESWLMKKAVEMNYKLKFKHKKKKWKEPYQLHSPYGPLWLNSVKQGRQLFVIHDEKGNETDKEGSHFHLTDKYRIVNFFIYSKIDLYILKSFGILNDNYFPHENEQLDELKQKWSAFSAIFQSQPLDKVKDYFSELIAFYFAWMYEYQAFMLICAGFGSVVFIIEVVGHMMESELVPLICQIFFSLFLAIWASGFNQYWIRNEYKFAWRWGTLEIEKEDIQREEFKGSYEVDEVTGIRKMILKNKNSRKLIKVANYLCLIIFIGLVMISIVLIFNLRINMIAHPYWTSFGKIIPGIIYGIQIAIFDAIYTLIARAFTNLENYETMNQHYNELAFKLFIFRVANNYSGLFYIAFFKDYWENGGCGEKGCMYDLGFTLSIVFITNMALNILELLIPWLLYKIRLMLECCKKKRKASIPTEFRQYLYPVEKEARLETYDNPIEDHMEMALQFGYVALFGSSFPLIALLGLIEITLEIRVDAWKLCYVSRRPEPVRSGNIGIWKSIIMIIAMIGTVINSGIIVFTSGILNEYNLSQKFMCFIVLEHLFLVGLGFYKLVVPDCPIEVFQALIWNKRIIREKSLGKIENYMKRENILKKNFSFFLDKKDIRYQE